MGFVDKCGECGGELEDRQEGNAQGMYCKSCTWSMVTSYFPEYEVDKTDYRVFLTRVQSQDLKQIRAISSITGMNYLDVRKLLQNDRVKVFEGKAPEVMRVRKVLEEAEMYYEIEPEFKY